MNKEQALHTFWSSFGLSAYDELTVPTGTDAPSLPYLTYNVSIGDFAEPIPLTVSLWYRSSSWVEITEKAKEISDALPVVLDYDGGAVWLEKGNPVMSRINESTDNMIRRIYMNVTAEFFSR